MKIENEVLEVTRSGTFQERGFGIASNAKAFDILSSKIYTNVPLAIVRELSTNASDSHTDAGCPDKQFDVHLPNTLEPFFSIRDYGTGLSPDSVETVYTTYFKSTRSNSDDFTGCLGLGSKSPFAYTDQFSIISNWNGKKRTYSAFKNEQSCPSLALLSEVDTTEHNGLEIRIPIKPHESGLFVRAAQRVYTFFKVRPNIKGATLVLPALNAELTTPEYSLFINGNKDVLPGQINIVMGQVCYVADSGNINHDLEYKGGVLLNMPIGSCSIAASREEIHYDAKTIKAIEAALKAATVNARIEFEKMAQTETTLLAKLRKISKYNGIIRGLNLKGITHINAQETGKYSMKECSIRRGDKLFMSTYVNEFYGGDYVDHIAFIEDDMDITQQVKNKLRHYIRGQNLGRVFLVKIQDVPCFTERFGAILTKLSLLPDVPRVVNPTANSRTAARSKPIKMLKSITQDNMMFEWDNIAVGAAIDTKDACCVPRDGNWAIWNGQKVKPQIIREIANVLGFKKIYGISEKRYDSIKDKHGIEALADNAKDSMKDLIKGLDAFALSRFTHGDGLASHRFDTKKLAPLSKECDDFHRMQTAKTDNFDTYRRLCQVFDIKMPTAPDYSKPFFKKYPIFVAIDWYRGNITMDAIINYIQLIEKEQPRYAKRSLHQNRGWEHHPDPR